MTTPQNFPSVIRREKLQQVKPHGKWRSEAKNMRRGPKWGGPGDYSRAILWLCSVMGVRGGKHGEGQANEQAQRSRTVWVHRGMTAGGGWQRSESKSGEEEGEGERKGCWCFADALGVVEILQQRASPLLSNVHLVLQILHHPKTKAKKQ